MKGRKKEKNEQDKVKKKEHFAENVALASVDKFYLSIINLI